MQIKATLKDVPVRKVVKHTGLWALFLVELVFFTLIGVIVAIANDRK